MNSKAVLLLALASASLAPALRADLDVSVAAEIRLGRALPPPPPEVVVVEQVGPPGPPPWAHGRWYRRSHAYYYYPGCDVYYRPADRVWFYYDHGTWRSGVQLPVAIRVDFSRAVSLSLESDRPYLYHEKVVAYYPTDYFAKVKLRNDHDHQPGHREDRDRDDHDRGHGKGKKKK